MKKILLILISVIAGYCSFAQTNTFPSTGNVGIGTTSPGQSLTIQDDAANIHLQSTTSSSRYYTDIVNSYSAAYPFYINVNASGRFGAKMLGLYSPDSAVPFISAFAGIAFATGAIDPTAANVKMAILQSGNVGIGTILPTATLDIFKAPSATPMTGALNFSSYSAGTSFWGFRLAPTTYDFNLDVNDGVITAAALTVQRATHKVGIGSTAPRGNLEVNTGTSSGATLITANNGSPGSAATPVYLRNDFAGYNYAAVGPNARIEVRDRSTNYAGSDMSFQVRNTAGTALTTMMFLDGQTGNVGIGTSSPYKKLDIIGAVSVGASGGSSGLGIEFGDVLASVPSSQIRSIVATGNSQIGVAGDIIIQPRADVTASTRFFIQGNEKMRIDASGNIGIGTTNTHGNMLAVNGSAIATSMTVQLYGSWPDYVFKKDYQLPTLQEVKTYIDQNHHLPEMPSEQDITKDGLNLGEMNKLLTKKVEELTLYLIEKDKQVAQDEIKLNSQEVRINKLEKELELILKMKTTTSN
jgi:hypothetical protein